MGRGLSARRDALGINVPRLDAVAARRREAERILSELRPGRPSGLAGSGNGRYLLVLSQEDWGGHLTDAPCDALHNEVVHYERFTQMLPYRLFLLGDGDIQSEEVEIQRRLYLRNPLRPLRNNARQQARVASMLSSGAASGAAPSRYLLLRGRTTSTTAREPTGHLYFDDPEAMLEEATRYLLASAWHDAKGYDLATLAKTSLRLTVELDSAPVVLEQRS